MEAHPFPTDSIFWAARRFSPPAHSLLCHNSLTSVFAPKGTGHSQEGRHILKIVVSHLLFSLWGFLKFLWKKGFRFNSLLQPFSDSFCHSNSQTGGKGYVSWIIPQKAGLRSLFPWVSPLSIPNLIPKRGTWVIKKCCLRYILTSNANTHIHRDEVQATGLLKVLSQMSSVIRWRKG